MQQSVINPSTTAVNREQCAEEAAVVVVGVGVLLLLQHKEQQIVAAFFLELLDVFPEANKLRSMFRSLQLSPAAESAQSLDDTVVDVLTFKVLMLPPGLLLLLLLQARLNCTSVPSLLLGSIVVIVSPPGIMDM
jgi:hypothetical protein